MSRVSVVIPAYNVAEFLAAAIRSALAQTRPAVEVIVVDDGSTDGTPDVARGFGRDVRLVRQENAGPSAARNRGLAEARGEYVAFLDGDDAFDPRRIEVLLDALRANAPRAAFAASDTWFWDGSRPLSRFDISRPPAGPRDLVAFLDDDRPVTAILARREVLRAAGGFRPDLRVNEDFDLWLRLLSAGHTYAYVPEPLYLYRVRPHSLSRDEVRQVALVCDLYSSALKERGLAWPARRRLLYVLLRDRAYLSYVAAAASAAKGRRTAWLGGLAAGLARDALRFALRPHYSVRRRLGR